MIAYKNKVLISFIIPMYNASKYIGNCIESICQQGIGRDDYEIVVVDDGSTDNSDSIVKRYGNVRYFRQENHGQSSARNYGIEQAHGDYLCFVDADDALVPNSINYCLSIAIDNSLDMITYDMKRCSDSILQNEQVLRTDRLEDIITGPDYIERYNFNNGPWWYLIRREALGNLRFVEGRYGEDGMFTMELLMIVQRIAHVANQCYLYYVRSNSTTTRRKVAHERKMIDDYYFVYKYMQELIKKYINHLSAPAVERCQKRSESYLFFLLVRLLKYRGKWNYIAEKLHFLRAQGLYPVKQPYSGVRYLATSFVVNHYYILKLCNFFMRCWYRFCLSIKSLMGNN